MFRKLHYLLSTSVLAVLLLAQSRAVLAADPSWTAKYWKNPTFTGDPALVRQEDAINYNWGQGSPASGIPKDLFSARWKRTVYFDAGKYRFTATSDDGMRVWVDGNLIIDQWTDHTAQTFTADVKLTAGDHLIKVEYYEGGGAAVAKFSWALAPANDPPVNNWKGEYFNNMNLNGAPALIRDDNAINFEWGTSKPGNGVNADQFSVRWTRTLNFDAKTYRFTITTDDGMRVFVDDKKVMDAWFPQAPTTYTADLALSKGNHKIRVEYFDSGGGATAKFSYALASTQPTITQWKGEYYNNLTLNGAPVLVRDDANINFDWGNGAPASGVNADRFSVRWTRTLNFTAGTYRFTATSDDGMRVWVDDNIVIDMWGDHAAQTATADVNLSAGNHTVKVKYYENGGGAIAKVSWATVTPPAPTITKWKGEYFNNLTLSGSPAVVRDDAEVNFDWRNGAPANGVNADQFSARWTRTLSFTAGNYRFTASSDDGMRVWVDNKLLVDMWNDHALQTVTADINLTAGNHAVKVEYYEKVGSAVAKVSWAAIASPPPSNPPPPAPGGTTVTIDNGGPGFKQGGMTSDWFTQNVGVNGSSLWTNNSGAAVGDYNWARWYPGVKGKYEVSVYISAANATTTNARYWVHTSAGYTLRVVNQAANQGKWVSLGVYTFAGASYEFISLSDVNFETSKTTRLVFDAIKFEPRQ